MNTSFARLFRVPSLFLAAALQTLPIVRAALPAAESASGAMAIVFRWAAAAAAALGGVQAVSGASTVITSPLTAGGVQGQAFTMRLTTAPNQAQYWTATGLPPGLNLTGNNGSSLWNIAGTPTASGTFNVGLTAFEHLGSSLSTSATLVLTIAQGTSPPSITGPPSSQTIVQGQSATFSVTASGTAPFTYQWQFQSGTLAGQTSSNLVINSATTNNAGNYDVIVGNAYGSTTSAVATLTVTVPVAPAITIPPASLTVTQGQSAAFSATASGTAPLSFQWQFRGANLSGQTSSNLLINPATTNNAGGYAVVVSNGAGSVTSLLASLTVIVPGSPLQILSQPVSQTVVQNQGASFSVTAGGTSLLTYQWQFQGANLSGETSSNLLINPATTNNAGDFDVVVDDGSGSVTSAVATLTVLVPPSILAPPASETVTQSGTATFTVLAAGTAPLTYYWSKSPAGTAGPSGPSLTITNAQSTDAGTYSVVVSNIAGIAQSPPATLTVQAGTQPPVISVQPGDQTVLAGGAAAFTVGAGGSEPLYYQWYFNGRPLAGRTAPSLAVTNVQPVNAGNYWVVITNAFGSATSRSADLSLIPINGTYNGLYYNPQIFSGLCAGSFTITVTLKGGYSGVLRLLGSSYPFSGRFDSSGQSKAVVERPSLAPMSVALVLDLTGTEQVRGAVGDGVRTADLLGNRVVWNSKTNPAPQAGVYTLVVPGASGQPLSPAGDGFGTVKVGAAGRATFTGVLADGTILTQSAALSKFGDWPFCAALYAGEGSILGWLTFTNRASDDINGLLNWTELQQPLDPSYPLGFSFQTAAAGSAYAPPSAGAPALNFTSGTLELSGGSLSEIVTQRVVQVRNNQISTPDGSAVKLSIQPASGLFGGSIVDPNTGSPIPVKGVILQKQNAGFGYFLRETRSSAVSLGP